MPVHETDWTTDQLAEILACHRNHTSYRVESFCAIARETLLARPRRLAGSGRPDRVAGAGVAFLATGGRLALADPKRTARLLRTLLVKEAEEAGAPKKPAA